MQKDHNFLRNDLAGNLLRAPTPLWLSVRQRREAAQRTTEADCYRWQRPEELRDFVKILTTDNTDEHGLENAFLLSVFIGEIRGQIPIHC